MIKRYLLAMLAISVLSAASVMAQTTNHDSNSQPSTLMGRAASFAVAPPGAHRLRPFRFSLPPVGLTRSSTPASFAPPAAEANLRVHGGFRSPGGTLRMMSATGPLFSVSHDATLAGDGTAGSPLGVAVPLVLSGAVEGRGIITARNTLGPGIRAIGGPVNEGLHAEGGSNDNGFGGHGVTANGGVGSGAGYSGGIGIVAYHGFGVDGAGDGRAGLFFGDVAVTGMLSKGGGSFKIDHPLDPENKYLAHSFVESPDMKNIYDGNVVTDENGEAVVELPDYFEALNKDVRYQLTVVGQFAQAIVAEKVKGNRFRIKTSAPNTEVSWQVTGIRRDPWANDHRILVEQDKPEKERGYFLHPEAYGQPEERGLEWARNPELMRRMKVTREQMRRNKPDQER